MNSVMRTILTLGMLVAGLVPVSAGSLLVVWDSSDFKDALVDEIALAARASGTDVELIEEVKTLKTADLSAYDAVVAVNTGKAGRMSRHIRKRLEDGGNLPSLTVVTTYADVSKSRDPACPAADCITTASLDDTAAIRALAAEVLDGLGLE